MKLITSDVIPTEPMRKASLFSPLRLVLLAVIAVLLTACSSGSTSTGIGLNISGAMAGATLYLCST